MFGNITWERIMISEQQSHIPEELKSEALMLRIRPRNSFSFKKRPEFLCILFRENLPSSPSYWKASQARYFSQDGKFRT